MNSKSDRSMLFSTNVLVWLECILEERYGHHFFLRTVGNTLSLTISGGNGAITFGNSMGVFHRSRSDFPCGQWDAEAEGFSSALKVPLAAPGVEGNLVGLVRTHDSGISVRYDILGLTYWMLARIEEIGRKDIDDHGRFPATSSHAFKHAYLERPIVDEWLHIFGQVINRQWPGLALKKPQFAVKVSHDVDEPSRYGGQSIKGLLRTMGGDILKRGEYIHALSAPWIRLTSRNRLHPLDPSNTFEWIMNQSEESDLVSAFYFICGRTDQKLDALYEPEDKAIQDLMRRIHQRGHEIGLHPSYGTYRRPDLIKRESERLRRVCEREGIRQAQWGGRMHYLRWEQATTLRAWDEADMTYDSTLSYAGAAGFRCGTCFEYPGYDAEMDRVLRVRVRPLIAMESTVIASQYMGLGVGDAAFDKFYALKEACRSVGGCFTLLWHNSQLANNNERLLYKSLIRK